LNFLSVIDFVLDLVCVFGLGSGARLLARKLLLSSTGRSEKLFDIWIKFPLALSVCLCVCVCVWVCLIVWVSLQRLCGVETFWIYVVITGFWISSLARTRVEVRVNWQAPGSLEGYLLW